ncbi:class I SAM-dependent methyltransferase [Herbaspirillum autotrophicum]|uniref:class I SAM-dependent methyltransferase n=1 Tax=Herbaspirillum autotrophicum TaxID=180195 RepID=UPI00067A9B81|nr:class I SAM-dependent methyltransferase [Herbaspirillum autotrophicum]
MSILENSWGAFTKKAASEYLKTFGTPSVESKLILFEVIKEISAGRHLSVIDLGCGNANLAEYLAEKNLSFEYTGVDFSEILLNVARETYLNANFIRDDVNTLDNVTQKYDVAVYSHVIETLASPEQSLLAAQRFAKKIVIRFFEPPEFDLDSVELLDMDVGMDKRVPYLRRRMSKDYYRLILSKMGCTKVDVYRDNYKDQIHVLHY